VTAPSRREPLIRATLGVWALPEAFCNTKAKLAIKISRSNEMMSQKITTLIIDMYGVILKDRTGNFVPYTYEHFDVSEHGRIKDLLENQKLFTKAGLGHISSYEFLSKLGYKDPEYHMKNYIENYLSFDKSFVLFAEKYYKQYDFVLLSTDVSEWSRYITEYYGIDNLLDPEKNLMAGTKHLKRLQRQFESSDMDAMELVKFTLAAYNAGEGRIADCRNFAEAKGADADKWEEIVNLIPLMREDSILDEESVKLGKFQGYETIAYIEGIMNLYDAFCQICPSI
jgi:hypothetical protein